MSGHNALVCPKLGRKISQSASWPHNQNTSPLETQYSRKRVELCFRDSDSNHMVIMSAAPPVLPRQGTAAPIPQRMYNVSGLVHQRRFASAASLSKEESQMIRRCSSVENMTGLITAMPSSSAPKAPINTFPRKPAHAYEMEPCASVLYIPATDSASLRELSVRVSNLIRSWMDSVSSPPVQSIFVGTPAVTVEKFVEHLMILLRRMKMEPFCVLNVLHYVRATISSGDFVVCWKNIFRFLLASAVVTVKYYTDERLYNSDFASIIGLPVADINRLESSFLMLMNYNLFVEEERLSSVRCELLQQPVFVSTE